MDAYEATKVVFSRIQSLDPEHAAKIMGLLLIQDHGEKEMIRLAFGPEALLHSLVVKARKDLGLNLAPSSSPSPSPSLAMPCPCPCHASSARLMGAALVPTSLLPRRGGGAAAAVLARGGERGEELQGGGAGGDELVGQVVVGARRSMAGGPRR
ncbi:Zinc finger CCCH domain-containing protein 53 [Ananas comosus]|uniref:Zinc finger CCCH domain-containing protein 53 n=1 Tax=Ananas comosus TaxID=4615 RepID=A0A199VL86_ANACO|nr:Zinc finger CCCH domain-containing protein 53 [Ananas comosus]